MRAVGGVEDRPDDRDAERAADLARHVVDGGARAGLPCGQRAHDRVGGRPGGEREPGRHQRHRQDDATPVGGVGRGAGLSRVERGAGRSGGRARDLDRGRRLFQQESDREAIDELNRALYLSPYEAEAHLLLGRIHLRNGRVREAVDALKISLWSAETAQAHLVLGDAYLEAKDLGAARAEAERTLVLEPGSAEARHLLARIDGR